MDSRFVFAILRFWLYTLAAMDQEVKQLEEERGLPRILLSVFIGIVVVIALILVGGRIVQNKIKSDQQKTATATVTPNPSNTAGGFPTIAPTKPVQVPNPGQAIQVDQTKGGTAQLPSTGSPLGLLGIAIFSASAALGAFLRKKF